MGEADAARMLVAGVDTDRFTPKMVQVAVQSALANADPAGLCPLEDGIQESSAASPAGRARCARRLRASRRAPPRKSTTRGAAAASAAIDLALAEKVVGAGADTGRAATIEWDPVDQLTSWRFGLSTATGHDAARPAAEIGARRSCARSRRGRRCCRRSSGSIRR